MTQPLRAFHSDLRIKERYVERVKNHMAADNLIRGVGWRGGKGCAVGCTLEAYDHRRYPTELGVPEWLAHVEDRLFEGMSLEKSMTWPKVFLEAIAVGADLEKAKGPFLIAVLTVARESFDHERHPGVLAALERSIALWRRDDIGSVAWKQEAEAAWAAAWAADAAAWAAAYATAEAAEAARAARAARAAAYATAEAAEEAARAAEAAEAAARAAEAAADATDAAAAAAGAAAGVKSCDRLADELLSILRNTQPEGDA